MKSSHMIVNYHVNILVKMVFQGVSNGLVGFDLYFWRKPVKCK